jgi:uncharacterized protein HemX
MSEKHEDDSPENSRGVGREQGDTSQDGGASTRPPDRPASASPSRAPAYIALLVAIVSLAGVAWLWWQEQIEQSQATSRIAELEQRLERDLGMLSRRVDETVAASREREERVVQLRRRLDELTESREGLAAGSDERRRRLEGLGERVEELARERSAAASRLDAVEERLDRLGGELESLASRFDGRAVDAAQISSLLTVADLLATARTRVEVGGDFEGAAAAYRLASERLNTMDAARFDRLRERVAAEREALAAVASPDWASLSGTLGTLADAAGRWPRSGADAPSVPASEARQPSEGGWWSGVRSSLGQLVRVTPSDRVPMDDAAFEALRERLRLHLAAAQVAAARHDAALVSHHAEQARSLLEAHFESSNAAVSSALETLGEVSATEAPEIPELGSALDEIQRLLDAS